MTEQENRTSRSGNIVAALRVILIALVVIFIAWWLWSVCLNHGIMRASRLVSLDSSRAELSITLPKGHDFELLMEVPGRKFRIGGFPPPFEFEGRCEIRSEGEQMISFPVSSASVQECTWLESKTGNSAYILTWKHKSDSNTSTSHLWDELAMRDKLASGRRYDILFTFEAPPRSDTSLWLSWVQARITQRPWSEAGFKFEKEKMGLTTE